MENGKDKRVENGDEKKSGKWRIGKKKKENGEETVENVDKKIVNGKRLENERVENRSSWRREMGKEWSVGFVKNGQWRMEKNVEWRKEKSEKCYLGFDSIKGECKTGSLMAIGIYVLRTATVGVKSC